MNTDTNTQDKSQSKIRWLGVLLGLCAITVVIETYYLWDEGQQEKAAQAAVVSVSMPDSWASVADPSGDFMRMQKQMNRMMSQLARDDSIFSLQGFGLSPASPRITLEDDTAQYKVVVNVPKGENVEVDTNLTGNQLTIDGKVSQTEKQQAGNTQGQSLAISQFSQTLSFPQQIDASQVKVTRDGNDVVITVPKLS